MNRPHLPKTVGVYVLIFFLFFLLGRVSDRPLYRTQDQNGPRESGSVPTPTPTPQESILPALVPGERGIKIPVLLYHYISKNENLADTTRTGLSTPPDVFDQQLQLLAANGNTTMTFDELAAIFTGQMSMPSKPVILTFDDGYSDFYSNAYPLLKKYHMKGVAFIPTGLIGGSNYLTWVQIEEMSKSPSVVFGAHSIHHYSLPPRSIDSLREEVEGSKRVLETHVGYTVNWFAYPYGTYDERVVNEVRRAGFVGAITTMPGAWQYKSRFYYILRYRVGTKIGKDFLAILE